VLVVYVCVAHDRADALHQRRHEAEAVELAGGRPPASSAKVAIMSPK
jgi:hypothetical protein